MPSPVMVERPTPSRPSRLGTRRRRALQARAASEAGASRPRQRPASLDTEKHLATTVAEMLQSSLTEDDLYRQQARLHRQLERTMHVIWSKWARAPKDDAEKAWWARYSEASKPNEGESAAHRYRRVEKWLRANKPKGQAASTIKWERTWRQIQRCQTEWIGYKAACCSERSAAIAVPIGCNHRLCPYCAWRRSQVARVRIKSMFDRLTHPVMLTLTVPNKATIHKHDFTLLRQRIRQFIAQHKSWMRGGVYSIETTFNRAEKTWHVHAHVLFDAASPLPSKRDRRIDFYGARVLPFTALKWRLEFDWLCLWSDKWGKMPPLEPPKKHTARWRARWDGYYYEFERWVRAKREHSTWWAKTYTPGEKTRLRSDLSAEERALYERQSAWNARNTRVIDVRPVLDRDGAAREVLKYITKVADFGDLPEAVEAFCDAVRGARLIQTFGTWYGVNFDADFDPDHMDDWGERKCACGLNMWERIGVFNKRDVYMDEAGRWHLHRNLEGARRGTVARPTIRAHDPTPEERGEEVCRMWER